MITIQGQYNTAICYTNELEGAAREQIQAVCDRPEFAGCKIRFHRLQRGLGVRTPMEVHDRLLAA